MAKDTLVEKKVHHVLRYISRGMPLEGAYSSEEVNMYLSEWMAKGYELFSTHYVGENPEGYGFMYILVHKDS
mgnify:CR=1 FL=1